MAPSKKKTGFYFYMKEMKEREAAKGRIIAMRDMPNYAHPLWKQLSVVEKEPYEEMARRFNKDPSLRGGKLASDGTRVEDNIREMEEKIRQKNKMKQDVKEFCTGSSLTEEEFIEQASKKLLYFMSFNILCHTEDDFYFPIEIGLIEYSIKFGIHKEYTRILYPGSPPTGYAGAAKLLSEDKHKIDIFGEKDAERNMRTVWETIKTFTNPTKSDEYPPIFCEEKQMEITKKCLDFLAYASREQNVFEVWNAAYLLLELRAGTGPDNALPSETSASDLLNKTSFNYHPSTRCSFHEEQDNHYCALSYSKCLCYLMSDAVCALFDVNLTDKHIASRSDEDKGYSVTLFKETSKSTYGHNIKLDKSDNYYNNDYYEVENHPRHDSRVAAPKPDVPRQPASTCIAEEMSRLRLNVTPAPVPGVGLGRGKKRTTS